MLKGRRFGVILVCAEFFSVVGIPTLSLSENNTVIGQKHPDEGCSMPCGGCGPEWEDLCDGWCQNDEGGPEPWAEVFDPQSGKWVSLDPPSPKTTSSGLFSATLPAYDKLLLGSCHDDFLYLYHALSNHWEKLHHEMVFRSWHERPMFHPWGMSSLCRILKSPSWDTNSISPGEQSQSWVRSTPMKVARCLSEAVGLNGKIYVMGGDNNDEGDPEG
ncbi:hypothetical protein RHMOL_Rhmol13G0190600 [Rhododendron molle]|uniref:Uncharacterized protein n=1 Tax=Rhododendron molle TaxID=49168 RepID=A0ACC0L8C9_RHOML|nr:hypothetical protein RHMOL_Rhmol13G0190600 [Rhododendron molle]